MAIEAAIPELALGRARMTLRQSENLRRSKRPNRRRPEKEKHKGCESKALLNRSSLLGRSSICSKGILGFDQPFCVGRGLQTNFAIVAQKKTRASKLVLVCGFFRSIVQLAEKLLDDFAAIGDLHWPAALAGEGRFK